MPCICSVCKLSASSLCQDCVRQSVGAHQSQLRGVHDTLPASSKQALAQQALSDPADLRRRNETYERFARTVRELHEELDRMHRKREEAQQRLEMARERLRRRRSNLARARERLASLWPPDALLSTRLPGAYEPAATLLALMHTRIDTLQREWDSVATTVAQARHKLVKEAISTFALESKWVGPPRASKSQIVVHKTRLKYLIAGCVLPTFSELIAACHIDQVKETNAAIYMLAHCVWLVAYYLGITLPFSIDLSASPSICGASATRWRHSYEAPLPLAFIPSKKMNSAAQSASAFTATGIFTDFVTAYSMLVYDVAYLGVTQGQTCNISNVNEVVPALIALATVEAELRPSDALAYRPVPPEMAAFPALNFGKLQGLNLSAATVCTGDAVDIKESEEEGWFTVKYGT